jgi:hypothetical protein
MLKSKPSKDKVDLWENRSAAAFKFFIGSEESSRQSTMKQVADAKK